MVLHNNNKITRLLAPPCFVVQHKDRDELFLPSRTECLASREHSRLADKAEKHSLLGSSSSKTNSCKSWNQSANAALVYTENPLLS